jgi:hypothetical protein
MNYVGIRHILFLSSLLIKQNKFGLQNNSRLAVEDHVQRAFSKIASSNTDSVISHYLFEIFLADSTLHGVSLYLW